ncbi:hypothetical protein SLS60_002196 [Paraconiothyrium brasiliense]|uniref:Rhodopsin domain-containing protein n=1 Tax=Paraconiothyrium brasiliense TaxID=300254 RepID=A0ABR3S2T1_9PLEO
MLCSESGSTKCSYFDPSGELVKWLYILAIYYSTMHFLIKNAFLTYYLRLSINRGFRLWVGLGFGLNIGLLLINLLLIVFQCVPVAAAFNPLMRLAGAECMNRYYVLMAPSTVNVMLDFYVFVLPIPILWQLQMPMRKKIGVISVFAFGGISVILGVIRFHSLLKLVDLNPHVTAKGVGEVIIVAALELNVAAIAVNLPAIRSIYVKYAKKYGKAGNSSSTGGISRSQTYTVSTSSKSPQKLQFELHKPPRRPLSRPPPPRPDPPEITRTESEEGLWDGPTMHSPTTTIWAGRDSGLQETMDLANRHQS